MKINLAKRSGITIDEFKTWLAQLIVDKKGALPDLNDWKQIKDMLDKVKTRPEHDEDYALIPLEDITITQDVNMLDGLKELEDFLNQEIEKEWSSVGYNGLTDDEYEFQYLIEDGYMVELLDQAFLERPDFFETTYNGSHIRLYTEPSHETQENKHGNTNTKKEE